MEVGIPHTSRTNPGLKSLGRNLKRWYSGFNGGSIKLAEKAISEKSKSFKDYYSKAGPRSF
jgi:hypothetical protein